MYSIIDSCDETSGWHLLGLCNVKETDRAFVVQTSCADLCECRENLATGLNILRCHKAWLHTVDCTTEPCQEREWCFFFFSSCHKCDWLHYVSRALPFTDFMSIQKKIQTRMKRKAWSVKHLRWKDASTLRVQQLVSASGWRSRNNLSEHSQVLNTVWERCMLCVSDFCCYKYLP